MAGAHHRPRLLDRMRGMNVSIAGFIEEADRAGHCLLPTTWGATSPSSYVTEHAYEHIAGLILDGLRAAQPFDAVYLCLHGAMVAEHLEDGEGELLRRVRVLVGNDVPVVASLDLHSNTTPEMVEHADALVGYRTYPHIDMADTGRRTALHLEGLLGGSGAVHKAFRQIPFIIPITWQCTTTEPMQSVMAMRDDLERGEVASLSVTPGFPAADIHHCGPAVVGYGRTADAARRAVDAIARRDRAARERFRGGALYAGRRRAGGRSRSRGPRRGRSSSPTPRTIRAPAATPTPPACCARSSTPTPRRPRSGCWWTPRRRLPPTGRGRGPRSTSPSAASPAFRATRPFEAEFRVEQVGDGKVLGTGPMYGGARMNLGPMASLRIRDIQILVGSRKAQLADQAMYRHCGIEPTTRKIIVNKSSVHFRADFEPIASEVLICVAPGPMVADPGVLPWTRLRRGMRVRPNGPAFAGA